MDSVNWIPLHLRRGKEAWLARVLMHAVVMAAGSAACTTALAQSSILSPSGWFLQAGVASGTQTLTAGLAWNWDKTWDAGDGRLTGYLEGSVAAWNYRSPHGDGRSQLAQVALTPILRYTPSHGTARWFVDGGIGISVTSSKFASDRKTFSTTFNFGSVIGVGFNFGVERQHEVSIRLQHFSNAGIREPNPGENFLQLRYAYRFL